ncbi:hypothetical protein GCM10027448_40180 [Nocardioides dilutus]
MPRAIAAIALAGLLLTGCGDDQDGAGAQNGDSRADHNDADVAFASDMIQHHAQALAMVDLTVERDLDPEVQALAEAIRAAQGPEIETMTDWLTQWGEPVPATVRDHVNAEGDEHGGDGEHGDVDMDDTGADMPGMMSEEQMDQLEGAGDPEFRDLFLEMMIEHHEGAIEMARTEQADGKYAPAVELAEQIEAAQAAEIATMQALLS